MHTAGKQHKTNACRRVQGFTGWKGVQTGEEEGEEKVNSQEAKADKGKLELSLVPVQIIRDVAKVRMYGNAKYHSPDNWRQVELNRYIDAMYRHFLCVVENPLSLDEESGLYHYQHCACNMAFICEMLGDIQNGKARKR